jgi:SPASM domain peptide maturase of grasp-with-spasm system
LTSNNKKIKRFASSIPVKGAKRSIICDVQRGSYIFIPNDLYDVLIKHDGKSLFEIKKSYYNRYDLILDEYFEFLIEKEHVFYTNIPDLFSNISMQWFEPFQINNAIIDVDENLDFKKILLQLEELKCKSVEFRFFSSEKQKIINDILFFLEDKKLIAYSLGFVVPNSIETHLKDLENIILNNPRISYFIITNATENNFVESSREKRGYVFYTKEKIFSSSHCGLIDKEYFTVNTKLFTESQHHNTCLNRKISIDIDGNIKNCPSMDHSFGNIKDTTLEEALNHPNFKKYWNITKDQIEVCKDCEFRHICTDCRVYIEEPENKYSKPLKCGYNPYTNEWAEWSTNPLKQKAIEYYGMQDLVKKDA